MFLLKGGFVAEIHPARLEPLDLRVHADRIVEVGSHLEPGRGERVLDVTGKLVMPGMVCAHTHLYSALSRGMPGPAHTPRTFLEILEHVWWRLDQALDEESLYASAIVGAVEAIRSGTTTLIDHHASPGFIRGSLDVIARALEDVGLRGILCYEVTDRGGPARRDEGLDEHRAFLSRPASPLIRGMVGGHAPFTLGPDSLQAMAEIASEYGVGSHIHVAEDGFDVAEARRQYGMHVMERLLKAGLLNDRSIVAHGVHFRAQDLALLEESGAWLVHNPRSNMNNAVGYAEAVRDSKRVALGTDGIGADMFDEAKAAFYRSQEAQLGLGAEGVARMLANGAQIASDTFQLPMGTLQPGAAADLMVVDYASPTRLTPGNLPWHFIFGMSSRSVETVFVAGKPVMEAGRFAQLDLDRLYAQARDAADRLWARMAQVPPMLHQPSPVH